MDGLVGGKSENWIHRLLMRLASTGHREVTPLRHEPRTSYPLLAVAGSNEEAWTPVWNQISQGADKLGLHRAQLEIRSHQGFHTFHFESSQGVDEIPFLRWEATACIYVGSDLVGRMVFVGDRGDKDLSVYFNQLAGLVEQIENHVRELIVPRILTHRLSNEIRLSAVA